ncbi:DUF6519 domain-containing protein [Novosphingobium sp. MBES04]|uniref:DUF6519 domain-containing protein n=1 Tax=Novosphingobium sp. MBES04 TaxID=1206458 RepID=UPI00057EE9B9|nr:DUF6519 domain-containing protein [Novosphingobium sp. MBES04]GAM03491.1 hypothetical protein MBENS4_0490 [Novosphingobium sp. MBES04]
MTQRSDSTRTTIPTGEARPLRDVRLNQGQVLLDTDLNEQGRLLLERIETETQGTLGAPGRLVIAQGSSAFALTASGSASSLADITIGAGHGWLDGWQLDNPHEVTLASQPHPVEEADFGSGGALAIKALVRYVDPVEEPALADTALGNAQASGRTLVDWQVFPLPLDEDGAASCTAAAQSPAWQAITAPSSGTLAFRVEASPASLDPCSLTPEGGYARLENLLYRIEVHTGEVDAVVPDVDGPRFGLEGLRITFSRRNASLMARVTKVSGTEITVSPAARDPRSWFAPGQYAEIVSRHDDLDTRSASAAQRLFRIAAASDTRVTLEASPAQLAASGITADGDWYLRLWDAFPDGSGTRTIALDASGLSQVIDLGDGLAVQLGGGSAARVRRGDFWTCAARADGTIEWPMSSGQFARVTPQGPETRYALLGTYALADSALVLGDCRVAFAPLTEQIQVLALGGDGQSVRADTHTNALVALPSDLRVGVVRGSTPLAGQTIRFRVIAGGGELGAGSQTLDALTDAEGVARAAWSLGPDAPAQEVEAVRIDAQGNATNAPIRFTGFLARADETAFDPANTPSLAGAFDVQQAIERLAGQGQIGCSTYVIQEGSDWVAVLEAIKEGEDASICFQRGTFAATKPVRLAGKGHLTLHGAGPGTLIRVEGSETALEFVDCASVELSALHVSAPTPGDRIAQAKHRGGTLTITGCRDVKVTDTTLTCGASSSPQRCGLRIAGQPLRNVAAHVSRCTFRTGYMQDALLVSDCERVDIQDNTFEALARPQRFDFTHLASDPRWSAIAARSLIRALEEAMPPASGNGPVVKGLRYTVRLTSTVPQAEWDALVEADPPSARDERTETAFAGYVERLLGKALVQPTLLPSFEGNLRTLTASLGPRGAPQLDEAIRRNMLASAIAVARPLAPPQVPGLQAVWLSANGQSVRFESPLAPGDWQLALKASGEGSAIKDHASFRKVLHRIARRLIADAAFAERMASLRPWRAGYAAALPSVANQAIACVGRALGKVSIANNSIADFQTGIRVATSHGTWTRLYRRGGRHTRLAARMVDVVGNELRLRPPGPGTELLFGMFFGNADTLRIHRNDVHYADDRIEEGKRNVLDYKEGIRLFGHFGRMVNVKDNHVTIAPRAIRMTWDTTQGVLETHWPYNWVFADNMGSVLDDHPCVYLEVPELRRVELRHNLYPNNQS